MPCMGKKKNQIVIKWSLHQGSDQVGQDCGGEMACLGLWKRAGIVFLSVPGEKCRFGGVSDLGKKKKKTRDRRTRPLER